MSKFFMLPGQIQDNIVEITGDEANHISRVLRMKTGDVILLCDSKGTDYSGKILSSEVNKVLVEINEHWENENEPPIDVILFQGLPKGDKMEYIIQKCVELGISKIVPIATEFAVAKLADKKTESKKLLRWNRISCEAAKQCGRGVLPEVSQSLTLKDAIMEASDCDLVFVPYELNSVCIENGFRILLEEFKIKIAKMSKVRKQKVGFFIGPEGGFSKVEMDQFISNRITPITLGKRILRTETASIAVLSILMYEVGDVK